MAYAVVAMTLLAVLVPPLAFGWTWTDSFYRGMTLMVVASPCALVISIPAAVLSALARSGRDGALFRGGIHLETGALIRAIVFDKTGTITTGQFRVARVVPLDGRCEHEVVRAAAAVEQGSEHPLAMAIVECARAEGMSLSPPDRFEALTGLGARAMVDGIEVRVTRPRRDDLPPEALAELDALEADAHTVVQVGRAD
jgi:Cd2+/Zn2+-exporting ATPase